MGWLFMRDKQSLDDLVAHFRAPGYWAEGTTILKDAVVGYRYWAAIRRADGRTFVFLALMENGRQDGWGYKDLCCSMHPYYYDCPLSILAATAEPEPGSSAAEWRTRVRAHHAEAAVQRKLRKEVAQVGATVELSGESYRLDTNIGRKGWIVTRLRDGQKMRMPAKHLSAAVREIEAADKAV